MTLARTALPVRPWPWPALAAGLAASLAAPVTLAAATGFARGVLVALVAASLYAAGAAAVAARWPRRALGAANAVTLARLVMVSWMAGVLVVVREGAWQVPLAVVGLCCLLLDGVDGRVARWRGLVSTFGARFDLEVDAALVLLLSVAVAALGVTGWWVVSIGVVRYAYVVAGAAWPWLRGPLFPSLARKVVGVCVVVVLLVALILPVHAEVSQRGEVPVLAEVPLPALLVAALPAAGEQLLVVALAAVCWSFARDARWQYANREEPRG
ncbi:CDP-alcohol phosphatidyltransferase family protein [Georgenia daeguensis]|uniref:CDP-alcohol phosphatidyltransferase family protein n=1 Tax=Georgenia daeguensis TaxID=908355 RepID=A0ABP8EUU8_9MICO